MKRHLSALLQPTRFLSLYLLATPDLHFHFDSRHTRAILGCKRTPNQSSFGASDITVMTGERVIWGLRNELNTVYDYISRNRFFCVMTLSSTPAHPQSTVPAPRSSLPPDLKSESTASFPPLPPTVVLQGGWQFVFNTKKWGTTLRHSR